jgi:hypothetical protein
VSRPGRIKLLCGAGNRGKTWFASGQHEIQQRKYRMNKYMYNYTSVYNFTCVFVYTSYAIKYIDNMKSLQNCSSHVRLRCCNFWNISTKLFSNVIYVYVNKQIISFQNFSASYLGFPKEIVKITFSMPNFSAATFFSRVAI